MHAAALRCHVAQWAGGLACIEEDNCADGLPQQAVVAVATAAAAAAAAAAAPAAAAAAAAR